MSRACVSTERPLFAQMNGHLPEAGLCGVEGNRQAAKVSDSLHLILCVRRKEAGRLGRAELACT